MYVFECGSVVYDGDTITDDEKSRAVAIDELPNPKILEGKTAVLKANKATESVFYEYVDKPKQPEIEQLKQVVADLTELVLFGGAI